MTATQPTEPIPTREQAAALLAQADGKRREAAQFSTAILVYAVICTTSGLGILLINFATGQQRLAGMIAWLSYVAVGAILPLIVRPAGWARGFSKRWGVLMGIWGGLWAVAVAVTTAVSNGGSANLQIIVPVMFSVAFLVLMVIAVAAEAERVKRERAGLAGSAAFTSAGTGA